MKNIFRFLVFTTFLFTITNLLQAQWVQTNGPLGGDVRTLAVSHNGTGGTNLFAGTSSGIYLSTNNGTNWTAINTSFHVNALFVSGINLFAGTDCPDIVYLSTNNGSSWTEVITDANVYAFAASPNEAGGANLFAGTMGETAGRSVFLSTNNGISWSGVCTGLIANNVTSLATSGTNIFAGTDNGVFLSTNNGTSWTAVNNGLTSIYVNTLAVSGTNIFAGTERGGLFLSTNNGTSWTEANTGLTNRWGSNLAVMTILINGTNIYTGTWGDGVFLSTNNGASWKAIGLTDTRIRSLSSSPNGAGGTNLFAGTYSGGIFLSTNNGSSWTAINTDIKNSIIFSLSVSGSNLYAGTNGSGVFHSTNNGISWNAVNTGLNMRYADTWTITLCGTNLFAGTACGVYLSTKSNINWTEVNTGLNCFTINALAVCPNGTGGTNLFAGTHGGGVYLSTNNGSSWTAVNTGLTNTTVFGLAVIPNGIGGTNLFACTSYGEGGVFLSTNNGSSWTVVNSGLTTNNIHALAVCGTNLFAGTYDRGVFLSTNNGTSWTAVSSGLPNSVIWALAVCGKNLFAGTYAGIFLSTNNGTSWKEVNNGLTSTTVDAFAMSNTYLFAGTVGGGVWRRPLSEMITINPSPPTTPVLLNPGTNLTGLPKNITLRWFKMNDVQKYQIHLSRDQYFNQIIISDSTEADSIKIESPLLEGQKYYWCVCAKNILGLGDWSDVWNFTTFISVPTNLTLQRTALKEITVTWNDNSSGEDGYIIERKQSLQTNFSLLDTLKESGNKYIDKNVQQGLTYSYRTKAYTKFAESSYSNEANIVVVGVEEEKIPTEYSLCQNFPNPFNPTTKIKFGLPENVFTKLIIYDILGRAVSILINEELEAGYHEVDFNASNLSSGIYFYKISTPKFSSVKKLLLMK